MLASSVGLLVLEAIKGCESPLHEINFTVRLSHLLWLYKRIGCLETDEKNSKLNIVNYYNEWEHR